MVETAISTASTTMICLGPRAAWAPEPKLPTTPATPYARRRPLISAGPRAGDLLEERADVGVGGEVARHDERGGDQGGPERAVAPDGEQLGGPYRLGGGQRRQHQDQRDQDHDGEHGHRHERRAPPGQ
ncbi:hypothetical protein GCM10020219_094830 [Nonomuraea dietziae]